jgi:hypothetical protein
MFKCPKCNKEFKFDSDFNRHKNRKTPCHKDINIYNCKLCKSDFKYESEYLRHEKTKKHKLNLQLHINGNQNQSNINGDNIQNFNNIIQLTLNVNSFKNTDKSHIRNALIQEVGDFIYLETMEKKYLPDMEKVKILFDSVIKILESLHFNLNMEENHNFKILLIFPGIKKMVYEFLILEINGETQEIVWNSLSYEDIIEKIFYHLYTLNNKYQNENYDRFILYLERYLIKTKETAEELKPYIQKKLSDMYVNFNNKQKKDNRDVKGDIEEKIKEYITYRKQECKLPNGFNPDIINSDV